MKELSDFNQFEIRITASQISIREYAGSAPSWTHLLFISLLRPRSKARPEYRLRVLSSCSQIDCPWNSNLELCWGLVFALPVLLEVEMMVVSRNFVQIFDFLQLILLVLWRRQSPIPITSCTILCTVRQPRPWPFAHPQQRAWQDCHNLVDEPLEFSKESTARYPARFQRKLRKHFFRPNLLVVKDPLVLAFRQSLLRG